MNHLLENIDANTAKLKMEQMKESSTFDGFGLVDGIDFTVDLGRKRSLTGEKLNEVCLAMGCALELIGTVRGSMTELHMTFYIM